MRLTKRDMALTKISIPSAIQSVYFRGKRYQYSDYLKIIKQANKNSRKVNFGHGGTSAKKAGQKTMQIQKDIPSRRLFKDIYENTF
tara:strand:+ start:99 stop:356 length:258 start_codon:yes stop_codon:yes gene_type:complete